MATTTINFEEVAIRGFKRVKCAGGCKRTLTRKEKFWKTINPFNKDEYGNIKSREQLLVELKVERDEWMKEPVYCIHCDKE